MPLSIGLQLLLAFVIGLIGTVAVIPAIIKAAHQRGLLDHPDGDRRVHQTAVPRLGGVGIAIGTSLAVLVLVLADRGAGMDRLPNARLLPGIALGALVIFVTGVFDDLRGLGPRAKLVLQTFAAVLVTAYGFSIDSVALTEGGGALSLGIFALPITVLWIVGMTNAFNLIDGVDGLAGTTALIALVACLGADFHLHAPRSILAVAATFGAVLGFLRFNNNPAKIFLGDSGSMTLGFFLAIQLPLSATTSDGRTYALVPLFALAFPLLDTFIAIVRRWLRGHPFSRADGRHIHHQLLALGLSPRSTVNLIGAVFLGTAVAGLSISFAPPELTLALMVAATVSFGILVVYGVRWLGYGEFSELGRSVASVVKNARTVVREKIVANEVAERIRNAQDITEVRALLAGLVDESRVIDVELVTGSVLHHGPERQRISPRDQLPLRLDYPFVLESERGAVEVVLRLWSPRPISGVHPASERLAMRIGPALEEWFQRSQAEHPSDAVLNLGEPRRITPAQQRRLDG